MDAVVEARKMQEVLGGFNGAHDPECFYTQEVTSSGGQDQGQPGQQEDHAVDEGDEGRAAAGSSGQRIGRA